MEKKRVRIVAIHNEMSWKYLIMNKWTIPRKNIGAIQLYSIVNLDAKKQFRDKPFWSLICFVHTLLNKLTLKEVRFYNYNIYT